MAKYLLQDLPLLEPSVDCFLSSPDPFHNLLLLLRNCNTSRTFNLKRCITNVSVICLHSFKFVQLWCKRCPKNIQVIVDSWEIRPADPTNLSSQDRQTYLIPQCWLPKLEGKKLFAVFRDLEVSTLNKQSLLLSCLYLLSNRICDNAKIGTSIKLKMITNSTHNMGLQVSNGHDEWPDVLPESLGIHCPSLSTSHCTCWLLGWVALHEEKCPKQM